MRFVPAAQQLLGPAVLVVLTALLGAAVSASNQTYFTDALVKVAIVAALYVFIGNSGVLSFGHISFVAVGAWTAGVLSVPTGEKPAIMPNLAHALAHRTVGNLTSLLLAALVGGVCAIVVGVPLMRLSGLAAGIATFAVLEITHNVLREWTKIGPGATTLSLIPESSGATQPVIGVLIIIAIAFAYQRSRLGRMLRASREDAAAAEAVGVNVHRQRLWAFTLSGALAGFAGGLYVHMLGSITTDSVYLELTFLTLAMLVVGGATSLWGAVLGALAVSGLDSFLSQAESGINIGFKLDLPQGTTLIILGAVMATILIVRPSGITGGREFSLPRVRRLAGRRRPTPEGGVK
jgi:branched-chain amino acid transport system permease protein